MSLQPTLPNNQQQCSNYSPDSVTTCKEKRTYTCFYLLAIAISLLVASLVLAIWWSIYYDDISSGFAMGSYMVGLLGIVVAVANMHRPHCRCWIRRG
ncbi:hypothetical protein F4821DRAFT_229177 [Hypoxylon rubiginosum]|uniref:Uncharacterized protein n=1 Tax=Hypoxylon rubiginosum TaxID=110542 RepID=A0ACC0DC91_9PEZI|nr:hypothetical protein F4821DRAFT_229177 [Hypoxylon rubiginosum]